MPRLPILLSLIAPLLCACESTSGSYGTLADAIADNQVAKGWVLDGLPASVHAIGVTRYVEAAMGSGSFDIEPEEFPESFRGFDPYANQQSKYADQNAHIRALLAQEYEAIFRIGNHGAAIVLCDPTHRHCEFELW